MPFSASDHSCLLGSKSLATEHVLAMSNRLKMGRINAIAVAAKMIEFLTFRHRTNLQLIGNAMHWLVAVIAITLATVS
jgi:hypothetical protein